MSDCGVVYKKMEQVSYPTFPSAESRHSSPPSPDIVLTKQLSSKLFDDNDTEPEDDAEPVQLCPALAAPAERSPVSSLHELDAALPVTDSTSKLLPSATSAAIDLSVIDDSPPTRSPPRKRSKPESPWACTVRINYFHCDFQKQ